MSDYRLYAFDMDGTLVRSFLREGAPREDYDRVEVLPGRIEKLRELATNATCFAIVTNQGGVAFGYQTVEQVDRKLVAVIAAVEHFQGRPYSVHVAYGHHKATVEPFRERRHVRRRKPSPVMLLDAQLVHKVRHAETIFVGDHDTDREAAVRAGVAYADADEFFAT